MDPAASFVCALGGADNVVGLDAYPPRIRLEVGDPALVDEPRLRRPGVLAVVRSGAIVQIVLGPGAAPIARSLSEALTVSEPMGGAASDASASS